MADERVRIYCRSCDRVTNHFVCYEKDAENTSTASENADRLPTKKYQTVECAGCETVSFREVTPNGDSMVENLYPPQMLRAAQNYETSTSRVPPEIAAIYKATMSAFNNGAENESSFVLCAGGIRCMLELICADLGIGGLDLEQKIADLAEKRYLTPSHTRLLQDARFLGNDALHEGRIPAQADLDALLDLFEDTINDLYIRLERFEKGEMLTGIVTAIRDDGIEVRVGKSTPSFIPHSELGIEPSDSIARVIQLRQKISVMVMSGRDEPLLLSKKEADAIIRREEEKRRSEEEKRRARWEALRRIRKYELLEGVVAYIRPNGLAVKVTKGDTSVEGWVPDEESGAPRNRPLHQAFRNGNRIHVLVLEVIPNEDKLILSKKEGDREKAYREAEEAFNHRTILQGRVNNVSTDGHKLIVWIGCPGVVHEGQLGQGGEDEQVNLNDWINQMIPVRVTAPPDRFRKNAIQLSHRAALNRKEALAAFQVGQRVTGKVSSVYPWGALVSVKGTDGVLQKADMASQRLSKDDEVQLEIVQVDSTRGYLGLKIISDEGIAPGIEEDLDESIDTEDEMTEMAKMTEDDMSVEVEDMDAGTSENFQEGVDIEGENLLADSESWVPPDTILEDQGTAIQVSDDPV
ncbi:MAG: S1 RNA-binding domain-containing protein [Armatimonadota bacterium]|nr:S1 RNA-binding domain-containing protein [Armatimonadota bacterium]